MFLNYNRRLEGKDAKKLALPREVARYASVQYSDKIAIVDHDKQVTYGHLYERSKKLADSLRKLGVSKGDKLATFIYNSQEYFEIRIATYLAGIVLVPIIWSMDNDNLIYILKGCSVKALIYHQDILRDRVEELKENLSTSFFIPISKNIKPGSYEDMLSQGDPIEPKVGINLGDLASINFSSGTTGRPKGISMSQKTWLTCFYNYCKLAPRLKNNRWVVLDVMPFMTAASTTILPVAFFGAKNVILKPFGAKEAADLIQKYQVNFTYLSASYLVEMVDYCKSNSIKLPSLERVATGMEAVPQAKLKEAIEFFGPIIGVGYGMAEILPPLCFLRPVQYNRRGRLDYDKLRSVGKPIKGVRMKIVDEMYRPMKPGKIGRTAFKSATISLGYYNNPELTKKHYKNGCFYSNDFGFMDRRGYVYLMGRKENVVKEEDGIRLFNREIEEVLHKHPNVLTACVFKADDGRIIACVSPKSGQGISAEELSGFCAERLEAYQMPERIVVRKYLPIAANGKLDRKKIKSEFK